MTEINLTETIDKYYDSLSSNSNPRDYFYISEAAKPDWILWNNLKNPTARKFDSKTKRILEMGDMIHQQFMKVFAASGILVASEIDIPKTELIHGRCDAIITDKVKNYIVDIKSTNMWTYQKLTEAKPDDVVQVQLYMHFFNIHNGILIYCNKNDGGIKEYHLTYNKDLCEDVLYKLQKVKKMIAENIEPEKKCSCGDSWCEICGGLKNLK